MSRYRKAENVEHPMVNYSELFKKAANYLKTKDVENAVPILHDLLFEKRAATKDTVRILAMYYESDKQYSAQYVRVLQEGKKYDLLDEELSERMKNSVIKFNDYEKQLTDGTISSRHLMQLIFHYLEDDAVNAKSVIDKAIDKNMISVEEVAELGYAIGEEFGNFEKGIEFLEAAREKEYTNPDIYNYLGYYYHMIGNSVRAIQTWNEAVRERKNNSRTFHCLFAKNYEIGDSYFALKNFNEIKGMASDENNWDYRAYHILWEEALKSFDDIYGFTKALALKKNPVDYLKDMVNQIKKNGDFQNLISSYASKNSEIFFLNDSLLYNSLIIKSGDESFDNEINISNQFRAILDEDIALPKFVAHFEDNGKYYYVMERSQGKTLTELINNKKGKLIDYDKIIRNLVKINAGFNHSNLKKYNFNQEIEEKASKHGFSPEFKKAMKDAIVPLSDSNYWCFNTDPSTDNWLINKDGIMRLDTESRKAVPNTIELAQLLNCIPLLEFKDRFSKVSYYINCFNSYPGKNIDKVDDFLSEYDSAVIYRSFANCCYSLSRKGHPNKNEVTLPGIEMIDYMVNNGLTQKHKADYSLIKSELLKR